MSQTIFILVFIVVWLLGCTQIFYGIKNIRVRGTGKSIPVIVLWGAVLTWSFILMKRAVPDILPYIVLTAGFVVFIGMYKI